MIRKAVIVILICAALSTIVVAEASRNRWIVWEVLETERFWMLTDICDRHAVLAFVDHDKHTGYRKRLVRDRITYSNLKAAEEYHDDTTWLYEREHRGGMSWFAVGFPLWLAPVVFLSYPAVALYRGPIARICRCKKGRCLKCGYDLTGNVSARCPECGERVLESIRGGRAAQAWLHRNTPIAVQKDFVLLGFVVSAVLAGGVYGAVLMLSDGTQRDALDLAFIILAGTLLLWHGRGCLIMRRDHQSAFGTSPEPHEGHRR